MAMEIATKELYSIHCRLLTSGTGLHLSVSFITFQEVHGSELKRRLRELHWLQDLKLIPPYMCITFKDLFHITRRKQKKTSRNEDLDSKNSKKIFLCVFVFVCVFSVLWSVS